MNITPSLKYVSVTTPGAIVDNAAFTTATIDTLGFSEMTVIAQFGAMDIAMTALKLQESDDSGMSGAEDIAGTVGGTAFALPIATSDNTAYAFHVKLDGTRKRYIDLSATGGDGSAGTYRTAFVLLGKAAQSPNSAAERGYAVEVFV